MKLRGIQVCETVCRLLYRSRRAEVTWETLSIVGLILSRIWHVGRDVDQSDNGRIRSRFGDDGAAITVSHKNAWSILQSEDALRRRHIFFERCLRLLDYTYLVTILDENVVNAFPTRTICPSTVNEDNIPHADPFAPRRERAAGQQQKYDAERPRNSPYFDLHSLVLSFPPYRQPLEVGHCASV